MEHQGIAAILAIAAQVFLGILVILEVAQVAIVVSQAFLDSLVHLHLDIADIAA